MLAGLDHVATEAGPLPIRRREPEPRRREHVRVAVRRDGRARPPSMPPSACCAMPASPSWRRPATTCRPDGRLVPGVRRRRHRRRRPGRRAAGIASFSDASSKVALAAPGHQHPVVAAGRHLRAEVGDVDGGAGGGRGLRPHPPGGADRLTGVAARPAAVHRPDRERPPHRRDLPGPRRGRRPAHPRLRQPHARPMAAPSPPSTGWPRRSGSSTPAPGSAATASRPAPPSPWTCRARPDDAGHRPPAASLNVTAVGAAAPGFLTVYPCGQPAPPVSSVNYASAAPVANKVIADGAGRRAGVRLHDVGHRCRRRSRRVAPGRPAVPRRPPHRVLDTRQFSGPLTDVAVVVAPAGAVGAVVNVTVTGSAVAGFATLYPVRRCGAAGVQRQLRRQGHRRRRPPSPPSTPPAGMCVHTSTPGPRRSSMSPAGSDRVPAGGAVPGGRHPTPRAARHRRRGDPRQLRRGRRCGPHAHRHGADGGRVRHGLPLRPDAPARVEHQLRGGRDRGQRRRRHPRRPGPDLRAHPRAHPRRGRRQRHVHVQRCAAPSGAIRRTQPPRLRPIHRPAGCHNRWT